MTATHTWHKTPHCRSRDITTRVMMEHLTRHGESKIVERCSCPLTGMACVSRIYTDLAVIDVTPQGLKLVEVIDGVGLEQLQRLAGVPLHA